MLIGTATHQAALGHALDASHDGILVGTVGHPLLNPTIDESILVAIHFHSLAAAVRRLSDRLRQQQALTRRGREDAPASAFLHEELVIVFGKETEQTELEAVLPAGLAVAAAAVAAELRENRHDLVGEVDRDINRHAGDFDRNLGSDVARGHCFHDGLAILDRRHVSGRIDQNDTSRL